jgi:hypothetical protein
MTSTIKIGEKCTICNEGTYNVDNPARYKIEDKNTGETKEIIRLVCIKCGAKIHGKIITKE